MADNVGIFDEQFSDNDDEKNINNDDNKSNTSSSEDDSENEELGEIEESLTKLKLENANLHAKDTSGVEVKNQNQNNNSKDTTTKTTTITDSGDLKNGGVHENNAEKTTLQTYQNDFKKELDATEEHYVVDDFDILHLVGIGGFGRVFQVCVKKDKQAVFALKVMRKDFLIKKKHVEYTRLEKDILTKCSSHPFVVTLYYAFHDAQRVYLIMEFVNGGNLFFHMKREGLFSEDLARFYAAETNLAIEHLHSLNIIHRDIKPENILIGSDGHIRLTDFGFAKELTEGKTRSFVGTVEYMCPEMILRKDYGKPSDYWSLGILIYDMVVGKAPFRDKNHNVAYKKILSEKIKFPKYLTSSCCSIIKALLNRDETKRLGTRSIDEVRKHSWFKDVKWKQLLAREIKPTFIPTVSGIEDLSNFDVEYTGARVSLDETEEDRKERMKRKELQAKEHLKKAQKQTNLNTLNTPNLTNNIVNVNTTNTNTNAKGKQNNNQQKKKDKKPTTAKQNGNNNNGDNKHENNANEPMELQTPESTPDLNNRKDHDTTNEDEKTEETTKATTKTKPVNVNFRGPRISEDEFTLGSPRTELTSSQQRMFLGFSYDSEYDPDFVDPLKAVIVKSPLNMKNLNLTSNK